MIEHMEGVEEDPDHRAMRQVPSGRGDALGNTLWISEDGCMRRKFYNPWQRAWTWGKLQTPTFDDQGAVCGYLDGRKETIEKMIAFSWLRRRKPGVGSICRHDVREPTIAHNLYWEDDRDDDDDDDDDDESWKRLVWSPHGIPCDDRYLVSSRLRVRTPEGLVLRGNHFKNVSEFCAVGGLLVDLRAAYHNVRLPRIAPSIRYAAQALLAGCTPSEYAAQEGLQDATAWTYFCKAVAYIDPDDALEWGTRFVDKHVCDALLRLHHEGDATLGGKLGDLADALCLPSQKVAEVRFVVTCLKRRQQEASRVP
jgi:hypothetical protein